MAIQLQPTEKNIYTIVQAIIQLVMGRQNSVGDVTLAANATTTVVSFVNCSKDCRVFLEPRTAHAAAALATTWISSIGQGTFTITHANDAQIDKSFSFVCIGG